jgi:hypothetical protein
MWNPHIMLIKKKNKEINYDEICYDNYDGLSSDDEVFSTPPQQQQYYNNSSA